MQENSYFLSVELDEFHEKMNKALILELGERKNLGV